MLITTNGLVTRSYPTGDGAHILHLVTPTMGRLSVIVKHSRKDAPKFAAISQLFTWGNYELYQKGDMYWLRGGCVLTPFYELTADLSAMALGSYLCDITSDLTGEGEAAEDVLRLLLNALYLLHKGGKSHTVIKGAVELRSMAMSGYLPDVERCCICGEQHPERSYLDVLNGQLLCADCQAALNRQRVTADEAEQGRAGKGRVICPMSAATLAAVRYVLSAPDKKLFSFDLTDPEERRTFGRLTETYLLHHLERGFETLSFYDSVKSEENCPPSEGGERREGL